MPQKLVAPRRLKLENIARLTLQEIRYANFDIVNPSFSDIEVANRHGHTCLMIACYKGHLKIARYLIDAKADVNRKSVKGNTALHDCAESGSLEIMKLLLANGAKIDVDAYGRNLNFSLLTLVRLIPQK